MTFAPEVVRAVIGHMNEDHTDDSLVIVRAFAEPDAVSAVMTDLDAEAGTWRAVVGRSAVTVRIPWTVEVVERADLRRAVVALHEAATTPTPRD
nr:DUF2470 domain-containing protein [Aeromicrobium marinum]